MPAYNKSMKLIRNQTNSDGLFWFHIKKPNYFHQQGLHLKKQYSHVSCFLKVITGHRKVFQLVACDKKRHVPAYNLFEYLHHVQVCPGNAKQTHPISTENFKK